MFFTNKGKIGEFVKKENVIKRILLCILPLAFIFIPYYDLFFLSPYNWHIRQPQVWQGGLELLLFAVFISVAAIIRKRFSLPLVLFSAIYMLMNGVLLPFFVAALYCEAIMFIGFTAFSLIVKSDESAGVPIRSRFLYGIVIYTFCAIVLSLLGIGQIWQLRAMTVILFVLSVVFCKKDYEPFVFKALRKTDEFFAQSKVNAVLLSLVAIFIMSLCVKSNTSIEWDSLWYGLRPQYVLFGKNSFFDNLNFGFWVFYYPKMEELFFAPISELGDYSFIICGNIFVFVLLLHSIWSYLSSFCKFGKPTRLILLLLFATIPAVANISATAKPDILGLLFTFNAFIEFKLFLKTKDKNNFFLALINLCCCTGTKLTFLLWGGILFLFLMSCAITFAVKKEFSKTRLEPQILALGCLTLFAIAGIHYRTYKLTGFPLFPVGIDFWKHLGFKPKPFIFTDYGASLPTYFSAVNHNFKLALWTFVKFLFKPGKFGHIVMLYPSCYILVFACFLKKRIKKISFFILLVYTIFSIYYVVAQNGGDGNYFNAPFLIMGMLLLEEIDLSDKSKIVVVSVLCACQFVFGFESHPGWGFPTAGFNKNFIETNFDSNKNNRRMLEQIGMAKIGDYVSRFNPTERVICDSDDFEFRSNCSAENFRRLFAVNGNCKSFSSYLDAINIKGLVLSKHSDDSSLSIWQKNYLEFVESYCSSHIIEEIVDDDKAVLYVFYHPGDFDLYKPLKGFFDDGWIEKEAFFLLKQEAGKTLTLTFYNPSDKVDGKTVDIYVNEELVVSEPVKHETFKVEIPSDLDFVAIKKIRIESNMEQVVTNGDKRQLSLILCGISLEEGK